MNLSTKEKNSALTEVYHEHYDVWTNSERLTDFNFLFFGCCASYNL